MSEAVELMTHVVNKTWRKDLSSIERKHHAILTLVTEAAEVADCIKKGWYSPRHDGVLNINNLVEEIGDVLYGLIAVCIEFDIDLDDCAQLVMLKLVDRYG